MEKAKKNEKKTLWYLELKTIQNLKVHMYCTM